jgi:hypothetical protein
MTGVYWLASYPKSGNTWLRMFFASLLAGGKPVDINAPGITIPQLSRSQFSALLDVEASDLTEAEIEQSFPALCRLDVETGQQPIIRKIHNAWTMNAAAEPLFPPDITAGVVYIARDPRDVAVSLAHHMGRDLDWTINFMANDAATLGSQKRRLSTLLPQRLLSWSAHVESWLNAPGLATCLLRYEDMQADPTTVLPAAAEFAGLETAPNVVARALAATQFTALREQEERDGFRERPPGMDRFFRRGVVGGWRDTLSPAQAARIEHDHGTVMTRLGYR